jgi:hypothetical protein
MAQITTIPTLPGQKPYKDSITILLEKEQKGIYEKPPRFDFHKSVHYSKVKKLCPDASEQFLREVLYMKTHVKKSSKLESCIKAVKKDMKLRKSRNEYMEQQHRELEVPDITTCKNCGAAIGPKDKYCYECGKEVEP